MNFAFELKGKAKWVVLGIVAALAVVVIGGHVIGVW